jgi:aminoglycoside/choline kinase family phosphotransferase
VSAGAPAPRPTPEALERRFGPGCTVEPLAGDASTRRYFRLRRGESTRVLVDTGHPFDPREDPFLASGALLAGIGLPVPEVLELFPEDGLMVLEDLGDLLLQRRLADCSAAQRIAYYEQAVDHLVRLHVDGTLRLEREPAHPAARQALDRERFLFEFGFFREHFLSGLRGVRLSAGDEAELGRFFEEVSEEVAGFGRVLAHRDYHARNLMLHAGELVLIDFQDARWGPVTYDLASLLRDSYVSLPEESVDALAESFRAKLLARLAGDPAGLAALADSLAPLLEDAEEFRRCLDLTSL